MKYLPNIIILIGTVTGALLLAPATLPAWGEKHEPSAGLPLTLSSGHVIEQTFIFKYRQLNAIAVWLSPDQELPSAGGIILKIKGSRGQERMSSLAWRNIPPGGVAVFQLPEPMFSHTDETGTFSLALSNPGQIINLQWQIDGTKYSNGELTYYAPDNKKGDLAFQLQYTRPALGSWLKQISYTILIIGAGALLAWLLLLNTGNKSNLAKFSPGDYITASLVFGTIFLFYSYHLLRPGTWLGPSDFSKELSYVIASAAAVKNFSWPVWSHLTCGGMGLLGNPEGTTLSFSTLLALFLAPERALWLTLAMEAAIGATGAYFLARQLSINRSGSIMSAIIYSLSSSYAYKIVEGIVMIGGALAFTPWALLAFHQSIKTRHYPWAFISGLMITAIFWRGDVHVIIGSFGLLVIWAIFAVWQQNSGQPFILLLTVSATFFIGASIKILPYLEQPELIGENVAPHSVQITKARLWDEMLLKLPDRSMTTPVEHGLPERFGYVGSYVGIVPVLLAMIGLFSRHPYKWLLAFSTLFILVLAEGTLYEILLRHLGPLRALLRMPTRLMVIFSLPLGLLAAIGSQQLIKIMRIDNILSADMKRQGEVLRRFRISPSFLARIMIIFLLFWLALDLAAATGHVLASTRDITSQIILPKTNQPLLSPHQNVAPQAHPSVMLHSGYLLPQVCGDQNNPPEFITALRAVTPLSRLPVVLQPNRLTVLTPPNHTDAVLLERFNSSWIPSAGQVIAASNGAIHLITPVNNNGSIQLTYISATIRTQQILLISLALSLLLMIPIKHGKI